MKLSDCEKSIKRLVYPLVYSGWVWRLLETIPQAQKRVPVWQRRHPFDKRHGTDTSGVMPVEMIVGDRQMQAQIIPYGASQPSIIRHAIKAIGNVAGYEFVDCGCGKGRALIVASEFPFGSVSGIELSSKLARIARRNLDCVKAAFPERPTVLVREGNVVSFEPVRGKYVIFCYHSFGREILSRLVQNCDAAIARCNAEVFFIYYNPVHSDVIDASAYFGRWYARNVPYDMSELGFGPDEEDTVVIWRSTNILGQTAHPGADLPVVITKPLWKAQLLA